VIWLAIPAIAATVYYCLVMIAAVRWRPADKSATQHSCEPLSILKPIHGRDPRFYEAILSHARQDYPEFEILAIYLIVIGVLLFRPSGLFGKPAT